MSEVLKEQEVAEDNALATIAVRKAFRRLIPWCMLFYILSYIDRINVGFAALTMNAELGLTAAMFGMAGTAFYIAYSLCEIPSNIGMARYGARLWISRIMITWGLASAATIFAMGPYSLAILRALVGAAEAGLLPGIMLYLSYWFPQAYRARANALFFMSLPIAMLVGAPLSGLILQMDGIWGLTGWRWLFLLEGLPSVIIGFVAYAILADRPAQAQWLNEAEKEALTRRVEQDYEVRPAQKQHVNWREFAEPTILLLSLIYFCLINTTSTFSVWTPLIVKDLIGGDPSVFLISLISAIPPLFALIAMFFWTRHAGTASTTHGHVMVALLVTAAGWVAVAHFQNPVFKLLGLSICFAGAYSILPLFWATTAELMPQRKHAVGIALVSTIGTLAAIVSPTVTGVLRDHTNSFTAGAWFAAVLLVLAFALMTMLSRFARDPRGSGGDENER